MVTLTRRQKELLDYLEGYIGEKGYAPTLEEIGREFGLTSLATVHKHLTNLEAKGSIRRRPGHSRALEVLREPRPADAVELPLLGEAAAGRPIEAMLHEESIAVPSSMARREGTFALRVRGDSMRDDGILDGDIVVVESRPAADNGQTECTDMATVWRWREHFQHDFAARMDWCVADDFKKANHNPVPVLNGDKTRNVVEITAQAGATVTLSAEGTGDPDGHAVETRWWIYEEAGSLVDPRTRRLPASVKLSADQGATTSLVVPTLPKPATVHVILEARDNGTPNLWAYRRAVVKIEPGAANKPN